MSEQLRGHMTERYYSSQELDTEYTFRESFRFADANNSKQKFNTLKLTDPNGKSYYILPRYLIPALQLGKVENGIISGVWRFVKWHGWLSLEWLGP